MQSFFGKAAIGENYGRRKNWHKTKAVIEKRKTNEDERRALYQKILLEALKQVFQSADVIEKASSRNGFFKRKKDASR